MAISEQPDPEPQRYWNEYDNPEQDEEGYYIYIDPDAEMKFPGQELFGNWARKARRLFGIKEESDEEESMSSVESSDEESTAEAGYGTFPRRVENGGARAEGYLSGLIRRLRSPEGDEEALVTLRRESGRERRGLLREVALRERKAETSKLYFYTTCLAMAGVTNVLLGMMTMTSRKKERGVVDSVVLFGTIVNLALGVIAMISLQTRRDQVGWMHRGSVYAVFVANVVVDVMLLLWVFRGL